MNDNLEFRIKKNIKLGPLTSFGIGGVADYFVEAKNKEEIVEAVKWAKNKKLPYFILGSGSNILIGDRGIRGLVIKLLATRYSLASRRSGLLATKVISDSGVNLATLVQYASDHNLSGLECLAGVPGTVGGAIIGNAGTKQGSIDRVVEKVTVLGEDGLTYDLNKKECQFQYRSSRFTKTKEIILEIVFKLKPSNSELIKKKTAQTLKGRESQPQGKSAGCIFKNPVENKPAGWLIEQCSLKGKRIGQAMISKKHANWITNLGKAKAVDVVKLIRLCQKKVKDKFNIKLEEEIRLIGEF